jgi:methylphosphotriester-DNA--protein-cysteine methyltransferase
MVSVTEDVLLRRPAAPFHAVRSTAARILTHGGQIGLDHRVRSSGLSQRQFEREFAEQVGVSPKLYSRIIRLNYALSGRQRARICLSKISNHWPERPPQGSSE